MTYRLTHSDFCISITVSLLFLGLLVDILRKFYGDRAHLELKGTFFLFLRLIVMCLDVLMILATTLRKQGRFGFKIGRSMKNIFSV